MDRINEMNVLKRIHSLTNSYSTKQKILASYIEKNYKEVAYMNSIELAERAGVSNPSVIRFANFLGYSGYPEMQRELKKIVQLDLSSIERINLLTEKSAIKNDKMNTDYQSIFRCEIQNLESVLKNINSSDLSHAVDLLCASTQVYTLGFEASYFLANYTHFALSKIRSHVYQLQDLDRNTFNILEQDPENSIAIVIAMPRYPNKTINYMKELHKRNISIILITDSLMFPYCDITKEVFTFPVKYFSYVDPLSAILSFINTLLIQISKHDEAKTNASLQKYEDYIVRQNIFFKE